MQRNTISAFGLAVLTALALPGAAEAQTPKPGHDRMGAQMRMANPGAQADRILELREELALTDAQASQIAQVQARLREQNAPLLAQLSSAREQMRAERPETMQAQREQMLERRAAMRDSMHAGADHARMTPEQRAAMTPEQRAELRERMRTEMQERGTEMRAGMSAPMQERGPEMRGRGAKMQERGAEMRGRGAEMRQRQGVVGNARMMTGELRPVMEQLRENTQQAMQEIRSTLTAEQQNRLRELRAAPRGHAGH
ncbi:MAG: hypothetical protein KFH98_15015 [Gemmatimonadetes bacterium]|nr:hypothetical protein [Gemmatimonadota bacterium]